MVFVVQENVAGNRFSSLYYFVLDLTMYHIIPLQKRLVDLLVQLSSGFLKKLELGWQNINQLHEKYHTIGICSFLEQMFSP
jgi:hypothetical protein